MILFPGHKDYSLLIVLQTFYVIKLEMNCKTDVVHLKTRPLEEKYCRKINVFTGRMNIRLLLKKYE